MAKRKRGKTRKPQMPDSYWLGNDASGYGIYVGKPGLDTGETCSECGHAKVLFKIARRGNYYELCEDAIRVLKLPELAVGECIELQVALVGRPEMVK